MLTGWISSWWQFKLNSPWKVHCSCFCFLIQQQINWNLLLRCHSLFVFSNVCEFDIWVFASADGSGQIRMRVALRGWNQLLGKTGVGQGGESWGRRYVYYQIYFLSVCGLFLFLILQTYDLPETHTASFYTFYDPSCCWSSCKSGASDTIILQGARGLFLLIHHMLSCHEQAFMFYPVNVLHFCPVYCTCAHVHESRCAYVFSSGGKRCSTFPQPTHMANMSCCCFLQPSSLSSLWLSLTSSTQTELESWLL